jgi:hypothetical protein
VEEEQRYRALHGFEASSGKNTGKGRRYSFLDASIPSIPSSLHLFFPLPFPLPPSFFPPFFLPSISIPVSPSLVPSLSLPSYSVSGALRCRDYEKLVRIGTCYTRYPTCDVLMSSFLIIYFYVCFSFFVPCSIFSIVPFTV